MACAGLRLAAGTGSGRWWLRKHGSSRSGQVSRCISLPGNGGVGACVLRAEEPEDYSLEASVDVVSSR